MEMIHSMGNIEYFEICEIIPNVQCLNSMTYRTKGIVCCACGKCLRPSDKVRKPNSDHCDFRFIPNYVIKAHLTGHVAETQRGKESITQPTSDPKKAKKECKSILDRLLNTLRYRKSHTSKGWDDEFCARYDAIAAEDQSYIVTQAERSRNESSWKLVLNTSGKNGSMDQRDDYQEAERTHRRLCEEHGKGNSRLHTKDQVRQRRSQQFTWTEEGSERVDPTEGWRWHDHPPTSSSSSRWQAASRWKSSSWDALYFLIGLKMYTRHQTRAQCHFLVER